MASLLDTLLNTRVNERAQARQDMVDAFKQSRVTAMGPRGVQFAVPDNRASTQLARGVANRLLGYTPQNMLTRAGVDTTHAFRKGSNAFEQLTSAGIGVGSTMAEVQAALRGLTAPRKNADMRAGTDTGLQTDKAGAHPAERNKGPDTQQGTPMTGDLIQGNPTQVNAVEGFLNGYQNGGQQSEQDFLQLDLFVNRANDDFQRLLHSSLFSR